MIDYLLDTDIFSEILKGRNEVILAREQACLAGSAYAVSVITVVEIVKGFHKAQRVERLRMFLERVNESNVLMLDLAGAEIAGRICADLERTGQGVGFADPIIAAIAIRHNITLVTGNQNHYTRIRSLGYDLRLDNWRLPSSVT